jgi:hypothetical protein
MGACWGSVGVAPRVLRIGSGRGWVVGFTPLTFYARERSTNTRWMGGWVGHRDWTLWRGGEPLFPQGVEPRTSNPWPSWMAGDRPTTVAGNSSLLQRV